MNTKQDRIHRQMPRCRRVRLALIALARPARGRLRGRSPTDQPASDDRTSARGYVSDDSAKFGEYNGLDKKGGYGIVDFGVWGDFDSTDPTRWKILGTDLGLDTRASQANTASRARSGSTSATRRCGKNRSDTYQTPYQGAGSNKFTLPSTWVTSASCRR